MDRIMNDIPENLTKAMTRYREVVLEKAADKEISKIGDQINVLSAQLDKVCESYDQEKAELEEYIKAQVLELEHSVDHDGVKASHRKAHERITWDNKMMGSILLSNPNLAPIFGPARKVTQIKASVSVKWTGIE